MCAHESAKVAMSAAIVILVCDPWFMLVSAGVAAGCSVVAL